MEHVILGSPNEVLMKNLAAINGAIFACIITAVFCLVDVNGMKQFTPPVALVIVCFVGFIVNALSFSIDIWD